MTDRRPIPALGIDAGLSLTLYWLALTTLSAHSAELPAGWQTDQPLATTVSAGIDDAVPWS